jgi:surface protein
MYGMFNTCEYFNQPLNQWNVGNVNTMERMFAYCVDFNQSLNQWNVGNVTTMERMFYECNSFNQSLNQWNVSNVTGMNHMFYECNSFNQPLNQWNVSNVTGMEHMFYQCRLFNQPLNQWNVRNVRNMDWMFGYCRLFNQSLNSWNVNSNVSMIDMFTGSSSFSRDSIVLNNVGTDEHDEDDDEYEHNDPNEQHYETDWRDFFNIVRNQREELTNSQIKININEDKVSFLSNKTLITNAINDKSAIKYGCIRVAKSHKPRRRNLRLNEPYFTLRSIGGYGLVSMTKIQEIINNPDIKCVEISSEPINNLVTTASFYVTFIEHNRLDVTGASHCQEGQEEQVYDLFNIPINSGGKRRTHRHQTNKRRTNKRRTNKRRTNKRRTNKHRTNKRRTHKFVGL